MLGEIDTQNSDVIDVSLKDKPAEDLDEGEETDDLGWFSILPFSNNNFLSFSHYRLLSIFVFACILIFISSFHFSSLLHFESRDALGNHNLDLGYLAERNESRSRWKQTKWLNNSHIS